MAKTIKGRVPFQKTNQINRYGEPDIQQSDFIQGGSRRRQSRKEGPTDPWTPLKQLKEHVGAKASVKAVSSALAKRRAKLPK